MRVSNAGMESRATKDIGSDHGIPIHRGAIEVRYKFVCDNILCQDAIQGSIQGNKFYLGVQVSKVLKYDLDRLSDRSDG